MPNPKFGIAGGWCEIHVVAPEANATVAEWSRSGRITWERRTFHNADLDRIFLVIAATPSAI